MRRSAVGKVCLLATLVIAFGGGVVSLADYDVVLGVLFLTGGVLVSAGALLNTRKRVG